MAILGNGELIDDAVDDPWRFDPVVIHQLHCLALFDFDHVKDWLEWGGYVMLFGLLLACGLGLPLPEDIPLVTAGFLISQHHMQWAIAGPLAWLGIIGGDCILYRLGWRFGHNITRVPFIGRHITMARIQRAEILFERYGVLVVGVGRLFAGVRGGMVVAAGTTRFRFPKFIVADGLAAIVSGGIFMLLGFWFGSNLQTMEHRIHEFKLVLTIVGVTVGLSLIAYLWWRSRAHKSIGDVVVEKAMHPAEIQRISHPLSQPE